MTSSATTATTAATSASATPTVFVLVPEIHTGSWVWDELAARLRESGARAHPVELTGTAAGTGAGTGTRTGPGGGSSGSGDGGPGTSAGGTGPGITLETHIADVLAVVDALAPAGAPAAPDVVLVGHGYGIHPALGAADRRPDRVARVVHLDTGNPQDGDPPLALVPDQTLREQLSGGAAVPPPTAENLQRWGSLDGVRADTVALLTARAVAQPAATLTQPLRLTGAVAGVPSTGVLCTANGTSIAMVELLTSMGDPRVTVLVERRVRLFELATGHWPMLSCPGDLAAVLVEAAAGGGRLLTPPKDGAGAAPATFLLDVSERPRERHGRVDLHLPDAEEPRPAVLLVHGGPVPADRRPTPRDSPVFLGYARYAASLGAVGVTLDHRLHDLSGFGAAAEDVAAAVDLVRAHPRVDGDRVALWFLSAGGVLSADWLAAPPPWLRCVALSYPVLAPLPSWGLTGSRFRPAAALPDAGRLPLVLTRVGLELPEIAATVEDFLTVAKDCSTDLDLIDAPTAHHAFETLDQNDETRDAVRRAMAAVLRHLTPDGSPQEP
jgi:hypothetical protein